MPVETIIGLGQLGALVTIAHRLGSLTTDMDHMQARMEDFQTRVKSIEQRFSSDV